MNSADLVRIKEAKEAWVTALQNYGNFRIVYGYETLEGLNKRLIWTEGPYADDEYITNEFLEIDDRCFYVFEKPYTENEGDLVLYTTLNIDCDCLGNSSDCNICEGDGVTIRIE